MTKSPLKRLALLCFLSASGIAACAAGESRDVRAYEITAVTISAADAGGYRIIVEGRMRTGGYTNPRLRPVGAIRNRELVLELVAEAPPAGAVVPMILQPVSADYRTDAHDQPWVRVVAETNEIHQRLPHK